MHLPSLFVVAVYASAYLMLLFGAICLACGLYYLVELAEEYTRFTKRLMQHAVVAELALHFMLVVYERMWIVPNAVGAAAHLSYLLLLRSFPYIESGSPPFLASCALFVASNVVWYRYFTADPEFFYRYRVGPVTALTAFYFLAVWLVPLGFFVSLTVNDSVLPSSAMPAHYGGAPAQPVPGADGKRKRSQNILLVGMRNAWNYAKTAVGGGDNGDILSSARASRLR